MKPVAGVTAWRRTLDTYYGPDRLQTLSTHYGDSLVDAGVIPVIFPAGQRPDDAAALVSLVDGILISGGDDLDPATYGHEVTASKRFDSEVDRFEIALLSAAREQQKPVLAICRGRDESEPLDAVPGPPWPLTLSELTGLMEAAGMHPTRPVDCFDDDEQPPVHRLRGLFGR